MKCMITGISGFSGSHLTEYLLAHNHEVHGLVRPNEDLRHIEHLLGDMTLHRGDLLDAPSLQAIFAASHYDVLFHLAGEASAHKSFAHPLLFFEVNVLGTIRLFEALRMGQRVPKIVLVTSSEIYGNLRPEELPVRETAAFRPESPYAVSKVSLHYIGLQYFRNFDFPIIEARAFNHIGPRQAPGFVVPDFCSQIASILLDGREHLLRVGSLEDRRDFVDVRDVVRAYTSLAERGQPGEAYNICSGTSISIRTVLDKLVSMTDVSISIVTDPARLRPSKMPEIRGSREKIERHVGWVPRIPLEDSLKATLISFGIPG